MKGLYKLREKLCDELEKFGEGAEMTPPALDTVDKLAHAIKNIDKVMEGDGGAYSQAGDWIAGGRYGHSYDDGRDGGSYRRRGGMGRYPREGGYSRGPDDMMAHMRRMMMEADTEAERDMIHRLMTQMGMG